MLNGEREWTETHEPWHEEVIDRGNRRVKVFVLGRETRVRGDYRHERLYIRGYRRDLGFPVSSPLSPFQETIVLQDVRMVTPGFSPVEILEQALEPTSEPTVDSRELVAVG